MFLPEMYFRRENNNCFEGRARFVENHDCSQSTYPSKNGKILDGGSSGFYSTMPSSHSIRQRQHALTDENIYEGDPGPRSYAYPFNAGNIISNSFSVNEQTSCRETENNSREVNPSAFCKDRNLTKHGEQSGLYPDEGSNTFLEDQDFVGIKATGFTAGNQNRKKKARNASMAANNPVERSTRELNPSLISRPSGSKDRHTMVLTSKGARDRRMRLSVGTAIKLYCVQDMLGFEQPSQAVEWLLEKSQAAIRELHQPASISSSHISDYVNTTNDNGQWLLNLYEQTLATKTCTGQTSSTVTTTESNNKGSNAQGEKREQGFLSVRSVASNPRTRDAVNALPPKECRAKARERARERTRQKVKSYSQQGGICGRLQLPSVSPRTPTFFLQDNTSTSSFFNMINETTTTDGNSNTNGFLHSLMFTKDSVLDSQSRVCISPPPAETQCSSLACIHYYTPQEDGSSFQSTGAFSGLNLGTFHPPSGPFPQALATTNPSSSQGLFCRYLLDHANLQSCNLCRCSAKHSIETPCIYDGALETMYGRQSSSDNVFPAFK